jgi:SAM-dependent methyltransferase
VDPRPTERFTSRVDDYIRYRPDYPAALIPLLQREIALAPEWIVADIGSGPGNLTRRFLDFGCTVFGVEPNAAMREAGERQLAGDASFTSVAGSAEATTLASQSVDLVTAGQAFHWFDPIPTRTEFQRILKDPGWVALIWNRRPEGTAHILDEYSAMLRRHSPEYDRVSVQDDRSADGMRLLFGKDGYQTFTLPHEQKLDAAGFWGRLRSASYTPLPGEPGHDEIREESQAIFDRNARDGALRFPYETQIYIGRLGEKTESGSSQ